MALKFRYAKKDEVPTELASHYVERDSAWVLDADGVADRAKLEEFRANNITLANQFAAFRQRFDRFNKILRLLSLSLTFSAAILSV